MRDAVALWIILIVGGFQAIANAALLIRGRTRLGPELEGASPRVTELLRTSWMYAGWANLSMGLVLMFSAPAAVSGNSWSRLVVAVIAASYVVFAGRAYPIARRAGLVGFAVMGVLLFLALLL